LSATISKTSGGTRHTGIRVGDIIGTVTECGEDESDCRDRKDPIVLGGDCGRHLESDCLKRPDGTVTSICRANCRLQEAALSNIYGHTSTCHKVTSPVPAPTRISLRKSSQAERILATQHACQRRSLHVLWWLADAPRSAPPICQVAKEPRSALLGRTWGLHKQKSLHVWRLPITPCPSCTLQIEGFRDILSLAWIAATSLREMATYACGMTLSICRERQASLRPVTTAVTAGCRHFPSRKSWC